MTAKALTSMSDFAGARRRPRPATQPSMRLARSVLRLLPTTLIALSSMPLVSGCVLPLSPQFEDPPAEQNFAPSIVSAQPAQGSIVTALSGTTVAFTVTVNDPNVTDDLYFRWIGDFPPYSDSNTRRLTADTKVSRSASDPLASQSIPIDCLSPLARLPQHAIMALVSDRPFLDDDGTLSREALLTGIRNGAQKTEAHWTLNLQCNQ
jgi:hypothetical protein